MKLDLNTLKEVKKITEKCPTYGTRRMAAQPTQETKNQQIAKKSREYTEK